MNRTGVTLNSHIYTSMFRCYYDTFRLCLLPSQKSHKGQTDKSGSGLGDLEVPDDGSEVSIGAMAGSKTTSSFVAANAVYV